MPECAEPFNLEATLSSVKDAFLTVTCRMGFDFGLHGLVLALVFAALAVLLSRSRHRFSAPFLAVARKISIACALLMIPGTIKLLCQGHLPAMGSLNVNSLGFLGFWALVSLHLTMEEMNYQWFGPPQQQKGPKQQPMSTAADK